MLEFFEDPSKLNLMNQASDMEDTFVYDLYDNKPDAKFKARNSDTTYDLSGTRTY